jgi:atypical dual specificity phosphatase
MTSSDAPEKTSNRRRGFFPDLPDWLAQLLYWPTFLWNYLLGRILHVRHWWDQVDDGLWLGAVPLRDDAKRFKELGISGVVNMCDEYAGPVKEYQQEDIEQLYLPTVDFHPPTLEMIERGVEFIHRHVTQGGSVYVHCKAGRARSATVVLCYLVAYKNMTPQAAQQHLLEKRPHINPLIYERAVVKDFVAKLQKA